VHAGCSISGSSWLPAETDECRTADQRNKFAL